MHTESNHICFLTGKRRFFTIGEALLSMRIFREWFRGSVTRKSRIRKKPRQKRVYFCTYCRAFHMTSYDYGRQKAMRAFRSRIKTIAELLRLVRSERTTDQAESI